MRNDLILKGWTITGEGQTWADDFLESIFFLGNGRMGVRGYLPGEPNPRPVQKGLYLAGVFGKIKADITDFVNLPTPILDQVSINGKPAQLASGIQRTLDMRAATLTFDYTLSIPGKTVQVTYERFLPINHPALILQRTIFKAASPCILEVTGGISLNSCNCPVPDDQTKNNTETIQLSRLRDIKALDDNIQCSFAIQGTEITVTEQIKYQSSSFHFNTLEDKSILSSASVNAETAVVLDKIACIRTSRDVDSRITPLPDNWNYDTLLTEHKKTWAHRWKQCDIIPDALDEELLTGLRFASFNLWGNCSTKDPTVSIGARGLSHGRYKGCYFWDTDLFMLPFFLNNDTTGAKNLCEYRVRSLDAARAYSKSMNTAGARYPWMAALDGTEQCETWDIGCSELHITADVAYAISKYIEKTADEAFYLDYAAEVFIETARFWVSRYTYRPETEETDLLFCKGPDEYCGITNNNLFTNVMVQHNLRLALQAAKDLQAKRPEIYSRLGITSKECVHMEKICKTIKWPRNPATGHLRQDDTFHLLEPVDISSIKASDEASYHHVCFDRLQRYQAIKQADVLLIMTRFPELFTKQEKLDAWQDFEPLCLHDSTLSFASHALFALQNDLKEKGLSYLRKALLLDLRDIMGNTGKEGLHLACMGEAWHAAIALI